MTQIRTDNTDTLRNALAEIERLREFEAAYICAEGDLEDLGQENDKLKAEVERLREALNIIATDPHDRTPSDMRHLAIAALNPRGRVV